jgi:hypothetical protein
MPVLQRTSLPTFVVDRRCAALSLTVLISLASLQMAEAGPRRAGEHAHLQAVPQAAHVLADRRRRDPERLGRCREAPVAGSLDEGLDEPQLHARL